MADARSPILPLPGGSAAPERGDAHAVIIGINHYQDETIRDLRYARADATAVHDVLIDPHLGRFKPDHVTLLLDEQATQREIRSAIGTHLKRRAAENDTVFVYFAGHGAPEVDAQARSADGLEKYLIPHDAEHDDLYASAISMQEIQTFFGRIVSKRVVFFIDSCYSGMAGGRTFEDPRFQTRSGLTEEFLDDLAEGEGRMVVTACGVKEVSLETPDMGHGLFTYYLVEGLKGKADKDEDGRVTMNELYEYVYANVERHARQLGGSMSPVRKGSVQGTVYLTQYETEAQQQARALHGQAQARYKAGALDEAARLWEQALQRVPGHEAAQRGLAEIAARHLEEQDRHALQGRQRKLLHLFRAEALTTEEYNWGMSVLEQPPGARTETGREVIALLDDLIRGSITDSVYLTSMRLMTTEEEAEAASAQEAVPVPPAAEEPKAEAPEPDTPTEEKAAPPAAPVASQQVRTDKPAAPPPVEKPKPEPQAQEPRGGTGGLAAWLKEPKKLGLVAGAVAGIVLVAVLVSQMGGSPAGNGSTPVATVPTIAFAQIPAGTFQMGATTGDAEPDESPVHTVTISQPFAMSATEVTQGQWKAVMGSNPSSFQGDDSRPVENVSWDDVQAFIDSLNALDGCGDCYRLPTEAEWEYAARAGTTGDYAGDLAAMAWYEATAGGKTHPVGQKQPNAWGLYDMHGNVWEWVQDWYGVDYYQVSPEVDPSGPSSGSVRVFRGGSWYNTAGFARSTHRVNGAPGERDDYLGFRLVKELQPGGETTQQSTQTPDLALPKPDEASTLMAFTAIPDRSWEIGTYEVTQSQWKAVMDSAPWQGQSTVREGDDYPAVYISWNDATAFIDSLNARDSSHRYRLPTQDEWEYACRAGTTTDYNFGDDASQLGDYAWYDGNAWHAGEMYPHRVGQKQANAWGLYDMHGNLWEWTATPRGRGWVVRGGSFADDAGRARVVVGFDNEVDFRGGNIGFRLVREAR